MSKYVIERAMPGAGQLSPAELRAASTVSNEALATLSPRVKWQHSYVTDDKIFCVYIADNPEAIHEHARLAGRGRTHVGRSDSYALVGEGRRADGERVEERGGRQVQVPRSVP